jgi:hypothetical protein
MVGARETRPAEIERHTITAVTTIAARFARSGTTAGFATGARRSTIGIGRAYPGTASPAEFYIGPWEKKMRAIILTVAIAVSSLAFTQAADAKGCLKGAAVGAIGGHLAGHHPVAGAAVGCAVGHHMAHRAAARQAAQPVQFAADAR